MGLKDLWTPKQNGVDDILAEDINSVAEAVIQNEEDIKKSSSRSEEANESVNWLKENVSNALKGKGEGLGVAIRDVSPIEHTLMISTKPNAQVKLYGKNILNYDVEGITTRGSRVDIIDNGLRWKAGGTYYIRIPFELPKGITVKGSFSHNGVGVDEINNMRVEYTNGSIAAIPKTSGLKLAENVVAVYIYKTNTGTALSADVDITNIQLEVGEEATEYEKYKEVINYTANSEGVVNGVRSIYPSFTLISEDEVTVKYNRDINAVINQIINAIISLGGNI